MFREKRRAVIDFLIKKIENDSPIIYRLLPSPEASEDAIDEENKGGAIHIGLNPILYVNVKWVWAPGKRWEKRNTS